MNIKALLKSLFQRKFSTTLLVLQLALTLGLIVNSAILALDTREKLLRPLGLDLDNTLVMQLLPTSGAYKDRAFYRSIVEEDLRKLKEIDGVIETASMNQLPIQNGGNNGNVYDAEAPEDQPRSENADYVPNMYASVNAIDALGLEIVEGRKLTVDDEVDEITDNTNILITESLAKEIFKDKAALGALTNRGRVVGIIKDFVMGPAHRPAMQKLAVFYNSIRTTAGYPQNYVIKVAPGKMEEVRKRVRDVVLSVQPERDIYEVYTFQQRFEEFYGEDIGLASLFTMLCMLMVLITGISSFAHAQFHISQQKKLIGIRRALGASRKDVMLYVLSENWLVNLLGCVVGVLVMIGLNMLLSDHIEVSKPDLLLSLLSITVIFLFSTAATWFPAYKTSRIPPVIATRTV